MNKKNNNIPINQNNHKWGESAVRQMKISDFYYLSNLGKTSESEFDVMVKLYNDRSPDLKPVEVYFVLETAERRGYKPFIEEGRNKFEKDLEKFCDETDSLEKEAQVLKKSLREYEK